MDSRGWVYLPPHALKTRGTTDRSFPLAKPLQRLIKARKRRTKKGVFLFETRAGTPPNRNNTNFQRLRKRSGVVGRFHDLRHTHATWLLQILPAKFVVKILGMSEEVLSRYVHVPEGLAVRAVDIVTRVELDYKIAA